MRTPLPLYLACIFVAMLLYGVITLLPSRSKRTAKREKTRKTIEPLLAIISGILGLGLLAWAHIWQNATATVIFNVFVSVWIVAGVVILASSAISKMRKGKGDER
jgi:cytochrome bd-type quinol oxidase subunit 2